MYQHGGATLFNWWVPLLVLALFFLFAAIFAAKKDSVVRSMAYTLILGLLFVYMVWWQLVPEIRAWHNLIPADCLIAGPAEMVKYRLGHSWVMVAHIPVNVSNIECHGQIGLGMELTNSDGSRNYDPKKDVAMCQTGTSIHNGSTAYVRFDNWRFLAPGEQKDAVGRYKEGKTYFCWVDSQMPQFVTFQNKTDWAAIFYPLACIFLIIFLCWSAGSFALLGGCFNLMLCDPWFLRIDAKTSVADLKRMRGDYDVI